MDIIDCNHDMVLIQFTTCNGSRTSEEFINYLYKDDYRIEDENSRDVQQQGVYDEVDILDLENMDNSEIASWQWCHENPGWYKDL